MLRAVPLALLATALLAAGAARATLADEVEQLTYDVQEKCSEALGQGTWSKVSAYAKKEISFEMGNVCVEGGNPRVCGDETLLLDRLALALA